MRVGVALGWLAVAALIGCEPAPEPADGDDAPVAAQEPSQPAPRATPAPPSVPDETTRQALVGLASAVDLDPPEVDVQELAERYPQGWVAFAWRDQIVDHFQRQGSRFYVEPDRVVAAAEEGSLFLQVSVYDGLQRTRVDDLLVRVDFPSTGRGTRPVRVGGSHQIEVEVLAAASDRLVFVIGIGPQPA